LLVANVNNTPGVLDEKICGKLIKIRDKISAVLALKFIHKQR